MNSLSNSTSFTLHPKSCNKKDHLGDITGSRMIVSNNIMYLYVNYFLEKLAKHYY